MALSTSEKPESISKVGQSLFLSLIFRKILLHVDRQWHSPKPKNTDQELYKLIWETFWDFLGIRTKCPSSFSFFIKYWATSLYGWDPSYPSRLGNKSLQKQSKEHQRDRWGLLVSLVGRATGDLHVSLSPTRDVVEILGVARNIINNMVMKKG